ncbi:MAG: ABC transporter permease [Desulfurococcaceae archaeon]
MRELLRAAILVAGRDLERFWRNVFWLAGQVAMNIADLVVFAVIFRGIVDPAQIPDYIRFITPGILCLSIFISAFSIGREVGVELRREVTHYLVSLPVTRGSLVAGRVLGGVLRGFVYQAGFLVLAVLLMGLPGPEKWVLVLVTTVLLATTMSSLSITLSTLTRDFNLQAAIRSLVYFTFFFVSNVFYPERAIRARLGAASPIVYYSPITMAANIYRYGFGYYSSIDIVFNVGGLLAWATLAVAFAYKVYLRNLIK